MVPTLLQNSGAAVISNVAVVDGAAVACVTERCWVRRAQSNDWTREALWLSEREGMDGDVRELFFWCLDSLVRGLLGLGCHYRRLFWGLRC